MATSSLDRGSKAESGDGEQGGGPTVAELHERILAAARAVAWEVTTGRLAPTRELRELTHAVDAHERWRAEG